MYTWCERRTRCICTQYYSYAYADGITHVWIRGYTGLCLPACVFLCVFSVVVKERGPVDPIRGAHAEWWNVTNTQNDVIANAKKDAAISFHCAPQINDDAQCGHNLDFRWLPIGMIRYARNPLAMTLNQWTGRSEYRGIPLRGWNLVAPYNARRNVWGCTVDSGLGGIPRDPRQIICWLFQL